LLKNSKCSESLQTGRERRPRRCEPNATRFVSNGHREREILQSVHKVKQAKKMMLTVQSVQSVQDDVVEPYECTYGDVANFVWQMLDESCVDMWQFSGQ
jgi:hypothetical protein